MENPQSIRSIENVEQIASRYTTEVGNWLRDGCQRGHKFCRPLDIIEASHRKVFRNAQPQNASRIDNAIGHLIVCREDRGGRLDDIEGSAEFVPALTTVAQPIADLGRVAARYLLDVLNRPDRLRILHQKLPTQLVTGSLELALQFSRNAKRSCPRQGFG